MPKPENLVPKKAPVPHIDNTHLIADFRAGGGGVMHIRPADGAVRGVTFAFVQKGRRVELASAVTHTVDSFTKKIGTKTAVEHFLGGKTIVLPLAPGQTPVALLREVGYAFDA